MKRGYLISGPIAAALAVGFSVWQCSLMGSDRGSRLIGISNGCFAASVIFLGLGALCWIASLGGFRAGKYLVRVFKAKFSRKPDKERLLDSYYDFAREEDKSKRKLKIRYLIVPGLVCLLAAAVCTGLFCSL